jgi:ribosomal-protein-alanine acetyltransferase
MIVRRMLCSDAPVVAALERAIFPDAWSEAGISEELKDELYGGYVVCPDSCASDDGKSDCTSNVITAPSLCASDGGEAVQMGAADMASDACSCGGDAVQMGPADMASDACSCGGDAGAGSVGYVLLRVVAGEGEILRVGVLPAFRRRGFARRLLEETFFNMDKDAAQWFLEVRERNAAAIGLYRSFGFYEIGRRKAYYRDTGEAAVLMRRDSRCAEP